VRYKLARGRTGQGRSIRVKVFPDRIKIQSFSIELRCSGGHTLIDEESVRDRLGKHRCSSPWVRFTAHVEV
jgi:hypothetical protein